MQVEKEITRVLNREEREKRDGGWMGLRKRLKIWEQKVHPQLLFGGQEQ